LSTCRRRSTPTNTFVEGREAGKLAKPGRRSKKRVSEKPVSLADQNVDKNLADDALIVAGLLQQRELLLDGVVVDAGHALEKPHDQIAT
jgi:hypothetical protein